MRIIVPFLAVFALAGCRAPGPVALVAPPANGNPAAGITATKGATAGRYLYDATPERVVDGDTLILNVPTRVRLLGIDCPELSTPRGKLAREAAEKLVASATTVRIRTDGVRDTYGRLLAAVELKINGRWEDLAAMMRAAGWVK